MGIEKLANILGAETVKKIYEDGASGPVQETGKAATDLIKAVRLFTAPIQLAAAFQDRLVKFLEKVRGNVPEERQMEAPPSISGPVLERLKYMEEENPLTELYLNLLSRAIDKERIKEAHPAFVHIIEQLAPDEAMILYLLHQKGRLFLNYQEDSFLKGEEHFWINYRISHTTIEQERLIFPEHTAMYVKHLSALNLVSWKVYYQTVNEAVVKPNEPTTRTSKSDIALTNFGKLFVSACVPAEGFIRNK